MAQIYIARSTGIGSFERHVVLKMILPERAHDASSVQMFLDEARLAASLNHQNVAQVFEVGMEAGIHFLAMEYVHGQDLRALLARAGGGGTRVPLELALTVVAGAAAGLDHAHERRTADGTPMGIVHRDVSPSNIMVGYDGAVKLLDFGIAKAISRSVETQAGVIKGKFAYMAPEQCRGRGVDRRSDVFSLGIILYEVTTQHRCFRADSDFDTMHRIVTGDVVRPSRLVQGYPPALEAVVMKALAVDQGQRYQSAGALLEAIEGFASMARMSLSTVGLGRFMRDMFGDVPEPWLSTGRFTPIEPREHTISNTAGAEEPRARLPTAPPPRASSPPPAGSSPGGPWVAPAPLSSPGAPGLPQRGSSSSVSSAPALPPPPVVHRPASASSPGLPPMLPPEHDQAPLHLPPDLALDLPSLKPSSPEVRAHSYPLMPPGHLAAVAAAPAERSGSGPAHRALHQPLRPGSSSSMPPIASPRQGYGNAPAVSSSDISPRFEPHELAGDVSLQPNKRLLYIGLGGVLVGIIVLLAISIAQGPDEAPAPTPPATSPGATPGSAGGALDPRMADAPRSGAAPVKPEAFRGDAASAGAGPGDGAARQRQVHLHVVSMPAGAEVLLAGKPLGVTPLDTDTERRPGPEILTIHRARYQDVTAVVDLGHDYVQTVTLAPLAETGSLRSSGGPRPAASGRDSARPAHDTKRAPDPAKEDCQPPGRINPFEKACHGEVCKPCPAK
jgi:serine/threonine protein kinase